jgi:hypothetical protein
VEKGDAHERLACIAQVRSRRVGGR